MAAGFGPEAYDDDDDTTTAASIVMVGTCTSQ